MAAPRRRPRILAPLALLLAVLLVAPFGAGLGQAGLADWSGVDVPGLFQAGIVSVTSATLATALVALGGIPLGYLLARTPGRGMALLGFVVQLPLALPPLASGILLLFLLGYASPLGRLTHGALTDSFLGIVLAETFVAAPFLIVAARSAFAEVDPVLEDVAATLGHRPGAVFRRVSLALAFLGIWAGLLLDLAAGVRRVRRHGDGRLPPLLVARVHPGISHQATGIWLRMLARTRTSSTASRMV